MGYSPSISLITSSQNPHVKRWKRLLESRGIAQQGQFLVSGERLVRETLFQQGPQCLEVILPPNETALSSPCPDLKRYQVNQNLFDQLDMFGTGFPLLVCRAPEFPMADLSSSPEGLEVLCPLGDPANVGGVVRTAVAMGANKIIILQESAHPLHPKAVRSASGAIFSGTFYKGPSINDIDPAPWVVGLDLSGNNLQTFDWPKHIRILTGEEGKGVGSDWGGARVTIPMSSGLNSLNATVAAGMAMYAYRLQYPLTGDGGA